MGMKVCRAGYARHAPHQRTTHKAGTARPTRLLFLLLLLSLLADPLTPVRLNLHFRIDLRDFWPLVE